MKKMKSKNKILAVTAFAMLSLMGCNIDPILTDSYSEDVAWSNVDNLRLNLNGFYSLIGGYYGSEVENDACTDILKMNGPRDSENLFVLDLLRLLLPLILSIIGITVIHGNYLAVDSCITWQNIEVIFQRA